MADNVHPVFLQFAPWEGEASGAHQYDFLGTRIDPKFWVNHKASRPGFLRTHYPPAGEQYFEWVVLLETVLACKDRAEFGFAELGAGYGQWTVRAYLAFRKQSDAPMKFVAVEGDRQHYEWIREHLRNNGIDADAHAVIRACVSGRRGEVAFQTSADPRGDYGQGIRTFRGRVRDVLRRIAGAAPARELETVPAITLGDALASLSRVDLVHMDVQGAEYDVIRTGMDVLNEKVARIIVGTHSERIEARLRKLFAKAGWQSQYDFARRSTVDTEWGRISFRDGCQVWINPRL